MLYTNCFVFAIDVMSWIPLAFPNPQPVDAGRSPSSSYKMLGILGLLAGLQETNLPACQPSAALRTSPQSDAIAEASTPGQPPLFLSQSPTPIPRLSVGGSRQAGQNW